MTLPTQDEIEKMNGRELQTAALDFEMVYEIEIDRSTPKEELRAVLLGLLSSEPPTESEDSESVEEEGELDQEDEEESVSEEPENEQDEEDESPADIAEDVVDEVAEEESEIDDSEQLPEDEGESEEIIDKEDSPTLYRSNRLHTDWESGWSFNPRDTANNTPKPIENMTDGLRRAIEAGIVYAVE